MNVVLVRGARAGRFTFLWKVSAGHEGQASA